MLLSKPNACSFYNYMGEFNEIQIEYSYCTPMLAIALQPEQ